MQQVMPLQDWRRRACLSRRELARLAGISHSTVYRIERGEHSPVAATRRHLAHTLGVDWQVIDWPGQGFI